MASQITSWANPQLQELCQREAECSGELEEVDEVDDAATLLNRTVLRASDARVHSDVLLSPTVSEPQGVQAFRPSATRLLAQLLEFVRCTYHVVHSFGIVHPAGGPGRSDGLVLLVYVLEDLRHQFEARTHVGEG
jgi:hypothetical protein